MSSSENIATWDGTRVRARSILCRIFSIGQFFLDLLLFGIASMLYADAMTLLGNVSTGVVAILLMLPLLPLFIAVYCTSYFGMVVTLIFQVLHDVFVFGIILAYPVFWLLRYYCCQRGASPEGIGVTRRGKWLRRARIVLLLWIVVYVAAYSVEMRYFRDTDFTTFIRYDSVAQQAKSEWPPKSGVVELAPFSSDLITNEAQLDRFMWRQGFARYTPDLSKGPSTLDSYAEIFRENDITPSELLGVAEYHGVVVVPWSGNYLPKYHLDVAIMAFSTDGKAYRCLIRYSPVPSL